ncbi:DUF1801 domain-containing protein [Nonlabens ponticola]|uniref:DUF1801 domain-containing protein n=1 Tax=Nonlabens ponticola TaxID=2496866 RepID=A0A3S9N0T4_9FLAO|nr:DUF1801 domain-containing protein [Nonlabens ponticola]AZQ44942.1 DUF1801 domain-containing protein [Nonlabens ponticola]
MNPAEEYILALPEPFKEIAIHLQSLIEHVSPEAELLYKWKLPFYYLDGKHMYCFINYRRDFLEIGFINAVQLPQYNDQLIAGDGRQSLRSLRFTTIDDINDKLIMAVLKNLKNLHQSS